ncbi:hypothetical protein C5612_21600 [Pseudomonas frederiksbergensis]|uniref:Uncharacterized protein n=1 Tax=Pseudomonas frederiksbergensis TaxID=104087 RepID=A0A2S8HDJ7_9PSED|nr:hypothetical protein C5612_21600 [Pseudomonas frederiksbergensis]
MLKTQNLWERGLPAKNDDAQYLKNRNAFFAGKPAPTGIVVYRRDGSEPHGVMAFYAAQPTAHTH